MLSKSRSAEIIRENATNCLASGLFSISRFSIMISMKQIETFLLLLLSVIYLIYAENNIQRKLGKRQEPPDPNIPPPPVAVPPPAGPPPPVLPNDPTPIPPNPPPPGTIIKLGTNESDSE